MFALLVGFCAGGLTILLIEALVLLFLLNRLVRRKRPKSSESSVIRDLDTDQSLSFSYNKQGVIWVLEPEKISKVCKETSTKLSKDQKSKKEIVEVFPVKKNAKIKDHSLILTDTDGTRATIQLTGCTIVAVSAGNLSSRKWAKRYPIKLESNNSAIYNGSKICYMYLETSWEKESWCKALRLASCTDKERINWFITLNNDFHHYVASLNAEYPSFMKPSIGFGESSEKSNRVDGSSSKVRLFLKKLAKKASNKTVVENRVSAISSNREEKRIGNMSRATQDAPLATVLVKSSSAEKSMSSFVEPEPTRTVSLPFAHSGSTSQVSVLSSADSDAGAYTGADSFQEKLGNDEGTLCLNLFFSRLFFDAKKSTELANFVQARIQRTLSSMRTPSYIGGVTCNGLDLGNLPPYIHNIRVLPMDMNEVWTVEIDVEYYGGAVLDIETRLEVHEPDFQKGIVGSSLGSNPDEMEASDLLEEFEYYGNQLGLSGDMSEGREKADGRDKLQGMKNAKCNNWRSTYVSRWKSILNSIADHVSQVPLSLAIRFTSLRGTLRIQIKPPPSDRLWYAFTSMPNIDWDIESSVGEHKITGTQIALIISNRFKAAIRETLVLPNCESVCIPWMIAEKDDWVPRKVAPYIWARQDIKEPTGPDSSNPQPGPPKTKLESSKGSKHGSSCNPDENTEKMNLTGCSEMPTSKGSKHGSGSYTDENTEKNLTACSKMPTSKSLAGVPAPAQPEIHVASGPMTLRSEPNNGSEDMRVPLLSEKIQGSLRKNGSDVTENLNETTLTTTEELAYEGSKPRRMGRRAKMMDIGKKMGEKLEEKRRHIEEKGRNIVEKIQGYDT